MNRNKISLLIAIITILSNSLPASAGLSSGDINLIGIGAGLLNNILNPPHRAAEINADVELRKAKMAADVEIEKEKLRIAATADKVSPILNRWGVGRISCAPGLVFINGIDVNTVCVQPSGVITPGYYTYNNEKGLLLRTNNAVSQTTQGIQSTRVTSNGHSQDKGF